MLCGKDPHNLLYIVSHKNNIRKCDQEFSVNPKPHNTHIYLVKGRNCDKHKPLVYIYKACLKKNKEKDQEFWSNKQVTHNHIFT